MQPYKSRGMRNPFSQKDLIEEALPPPGCRRWSARRKASVVLAVRAGTLSRERAREFYFLSEEELSMWEDRFEVDGLGGLRLKKASVDKNNRSLP
jgi:Protein of unknown function (DUF1153)